MKFIAFVLGLLLIASCATSFTTSSPVNIDGIWEGEYDSGMGSPPLFVTFNFTSEGESLRGFVRCSFGPPRPGEGTPLENGKIRGNNISFTSRPKDTQMTFKYKGKIDGDKVKMTFTIKIREDLWKVTHTRMRMTRPMINNEGRRIRTGEWIKGERPREWALQWIVSTHSLGNSLLKG